VSPTIARSERSGNPETNAPADQRSAGANDTTRDEKRKQLDLPVNPQHEDVSANNYQEKIISCCLFVRSTPARDKNRHIAGF
jgi:hypothetical protein